MNWESNRLERIKYVSDTDIWYPDGNEIYELFIELNVLIFWENNVLKRNDYVELSEFIKTFKSKIITTSSLKKNVWYELFVKENSLSFILLISFIFRIRSQEFYFFSVDKSLGK